MISAALYCSFFIVHFSLDAMTTTNEQQTRLYGDLAQAAQEVRLLTDVLDSVVASASIEDVVQHVVSGIKSVLSTANWHTIQLLLRGEAEQIQVYQIAGGAANRYWSNVQRGVRAAARDLGVQVDYHAADQSSQATHIDRAIRDRANGVAIAAIDPAAVRSNVAMARAANIPLIAFDTPLLGGEALAYVGTNNYAAGELAAEALARLLPDGGEAGVLLDSVLAESAMERVMGAEAALGASTVRLLPPLETQLDAQLGVQRAGELLEQHPDLRGALGASGLAGPCWAAAAQAAGRAGTLQIVGFDITTDTISQLQSGTLQAVVAQREYTMGYRSVELLSRLALDGVDKTQVLLPADAIIDTGVDVVTLVPTEWSVGLADYLRIADRVAIDLDLRERIDAHTAPLRFVVIGMAPSNQGDMVERRLVGSPAEHIRDVLTNGRSLSAAGENKSGTVVAVPLISRGAVLGALNLESSDDNACSPDDLALLERLTSAIAVVIENNRLFQQLESRAREVEQAYEQQKAMLQTINELSNTIVPVARGVLVVPMVGTIDTARASQFVDMLLTAIGERQAEVVIIDITGVSIVDTSVAHHILQAARAAQLLGAEVIVVGITPAVAQTVVQLGMQFADIGTFADLETGFAYALGKVGGRIVYDKVTR